MKTILKLLCVTFLLFVLLFQTEQIKASNVHGVTPQTEYVVDNVQTPKIPDVTNITMHPVMLANEKPYKTVLQRNGYDICLYVPDNYYEIQLQYKRNNSVIIEVLCNVGNNYLLCFDNTIHTAVIQKRTIMVSD